LPSLEHHLLFQPKEDILSNAEKRMLLVAFFEFIYKPIAKMSLASSGDSMNWQGLKDCAKASLFCRISGRQTKIIPLSYNQLKLGDARGWLVEFPR
jgi:hypothetical protein